MWRTGWRRTRVRGMPSLVLNRSPGCTFSLETSQREIRKSCFKKNLTSRCHISLAHWWGETCQNYSPASITPLCEHTAPGRGPKCPQTPKGQVGSWPGLQERPALSCRHLCTRNERFSEEDAGCKAGPCHTDIGASLFNSLTASPPLAKHRAVSIQKSGRTTKAKG